MSSAAYVHRLTALALCYDANIPVLIWGPPGEGKSSVIADFADARGVHDEVVVASLRDPTDINGLPVTDEHGVVRMAPPSWLQTSNAQDGSIVVFDEINLAPPATRGACLRVVNERVSADTPLNPTTRIIAIANPPEIAEDGWELGAPMSNRFIHLQDWQLPVEAFTHGLTTGAWIRSPQVSCDSDRLTVKIDDARAAVAAFLRSTPTHVRRLPEDPEARQYAWPSPRSWTHCATVLGHAWASQADGEPVDAEVVNLLVEGAIGAVTASPFLAFLDALSLPDPQQLLDDPAGWEVPDRGDLTWASLTRLLTHLSGIDADVEQWKTAGQVIAHAADQGQGDVAVAVAGDWWQLVRGHGPAVLPAELAQGSFMTVFGLTQA